MESPDEPNSDLDDLEQAVAGLTLISAADYLRLQPPPPDQIFTDFLDAGDKLSIIGSSKTRKTFFLIQLALSLAAGRDLMSLQVPRARKILYVQFEIREHHFHRRARNMARALGITADGIVDNMMVINARGAGIAGAAGVKRIAEVAKTCEPEVVIFDPLYKLANGVENAAEDTKVILNAFDGLAEQTGAAIIFVHHDAKGAPGERDIRDRGAGSNVLSRDYDACIAMTPHATEDSTVVIDTLLRNYPPRDPFSAAWDTTAGGYCFVQRDDIMPTKQTSATRKADTPVEAYMPIAAEILSACPLSLSLFKARFRMKSGITYAKLTAFMDWAVSEDKVAIQGDPDHGRNSKLVSLFDGG